jgi:hypothetical protein
MPAINKCDHCSRRFGMIRYRWWTQQYCCRECYERAALQRDRVRTFLRTPVEDRSDGEGRTRRESKSAS